MPRLLSVLYVMFIIVLPAWGQEATALRGQVVDELNAAIPGASVTISGDRIGQRSAITDAKGEFVFQDIPLGVYTLAVTSEGFQPHIDKNFKVAITSSPFKITAIITLMIKPVAIETEVKAEDNIVTTEPDQNASATILGEEFIKTLPDNEDDLRAYLQALAGPAAGGAAGGQDGAQIYVNGFTAGRLPPRDAIMQIRINQNPFSAEYSRPGFGRVEIITKPGNDQWRGAVSLNYRNSASDARNAFALAKPELNQSRYGLNFGGPIIKKKMSLFVSADRRDLTGASPVVATTLNGIFRENVSSPSGSTYLNTRVDYLLNEKNTISVNYSFSDNRNLNREFAVSFGGFRFFGGGGFAFTSGSSANNYYLPERGSDSFNRDHSLQISDTWIVSSRLVHESRLQYRYESSEVKARTEGLAINVLDAFNGGGSPCCPSNSNSHRIEWQDYLTYTYKKHTIKGGIQLQYNDIYDFSASNFNGTYIFSSLDAYRRALNGEQIEPGETVRSQFTINRGNPLLEFSQTEMAWFVQDDYRLNPSLTLSFGIRHEFQTNLDDKNNFAPRIGIAWSPFKDRKTSIRIGSGLFYSRLSDGQYGNVLRFDGERQVSVTIFNPKFPNPFEGDPQLSTQNIIKRVLDPSLKAPYVINFNASVERQFPKGIVGSMTYIYTRGVHQFRSRNINAPLPITGFRPNPEEGNIFQLESTAQSVYHGLLFRVDRRLGQRFTVFGNYSLSWTRNDADGAFSTPADNYDLTSEWGRASSDRRHFLFIGGNINLPYRFRVAPFINAGSGAPFNITSGIDTNRDTSFNDRPVGISRNSNLPVNLYPLVPNRCIAGCSAGETPVLLRDYLYANFPQGVIAESPGSFNVNLNISKTVGFGKRNLQAVSGEQGGSRGGGVSGRGGRVRGNGGGMLGSSFSTDDSSRYNLTFSVQITNLFNRVNLGSYSGTLGSPFFARSNSAGSARQFDFGVNFSF